jgi:ABC-type lipoprotein release transport system permease subunit
LCSSEEALLAVAEGGGVLCLDCGQADFRLLASPMTGMISTGVLLVVGIMSGLIPAMRASRLDPAAVLHHE